MGSAESWYLRVSGCGRRRGRIKCQSIFLSQADRHLWDKVVFINTIFSKPHCHTGKHTFNKMPFSNCSQFPALPFGRGKVVFMMWTYSTEKNRWVLDSQQKQNCHWDGCVTSYKEGYSEEWKIFPGLPFLVRDFIFRGATKQMSTLWWAFPHFSKIYFLYT